MTFTLTENDCNLLLTSLNYITTFIDQNEAKKYRKLSDELRAQLMNNLK